MRDKSQGEKVCTTAKARKAGRLRHTVVQRRLHPAVQVLPPSDLNENVIVEKGRGEGVKYRPESSICVRLQNCRTSRMCAEILKKGDEQLTVNFLLLSHPN